ncbi:MAG: hypothetical protein ACYTFZ_04040 [Planctomycetota bacterium]|jgi:hypothetical protein
MTSDDSGVLAQILALSKDTAEKVERLSADQSEVKAEVARLQALNAGQQVPVQPHQIQRPPAAARRPPTAGTSVIQHFDAETDRPVDPNMRAEMWRTDKILTCPCGAESYAETHCVVGEMDIMDAQHPKVDGEGNLVRQPYRFVLDPQTGQNAIPEELRLTPEKGDHFRECNRRHQAKDVRLQHFIKGKLAEVEVEEELRPNQNPEVARAAHIHRQGIAEAVGEALENA